MHMARSNFLFDIFKVALQDKLDANWKRKTKKKKDMLGADYWMEYLNVIMLQMLYF